jgi:hypothetical protein
LVHRSIICDDGLSRAEPSATNRVAQAGRQARPDAVARAVAVFPPEKADKVLPIVDRWTNIMRRVNR